MQRIKKIIYLFLGIGLLVDSVSRIMNLKIFTGAFSFIGGVIFMALFFNIFKRMNISNNRNGVDVNKFVSNKEDDQDFDDDNKPRYTFKKLRDGSYSHVINLVGEQYDNRQTNIKSIKEGDDLNFRFSEFKGKFALEVVNNDKSIGYIPKEFAEFIELLKEYLTVYHVTSLKVHNGFINVRGQVRLSKESENRLLEILSDNK